MPKHYPVRTELFELIVFHFHEFWDISHQCHGIREITKCTAAHYSTNKQYTTCMQVQCKWASNRIIRYYTYDIPFYALPHKQAVVLARVVIKLMMQTAKKVISHHLVGWLGFNVNVTF